VHGNHAARVLDAVRRLVESPTLRTHLVVVGRDELHLGHHRTQAGLLVGVETRVGVRRYGLGARDDARASATYVQLGVELARYLLRTPALQKTAPNDLLHLLGRVVAHAPQLRVAALRDEVRAPLRRAPHGRVDD
jgi:CBS domain-containing protein